MNTSKTISHGRMTIAPLLVLRHGETEWNVAGRLQGGLDSPLTPRGIAQAEQQRDLLNALDLSGWSWRVSPLLRAVRTAEIARGAGIDAGECDPRLREIEMGTWTGRARRDIAAVNPALFESDGLAWYDHAPDGEGLAALADRCQQVLDDLRGPTVLVTHGITSRVLRCLATGLPWEALDEVGGGQGVVYRVENGVQSLLR